MCCSALVRRVSRLFEGRRSGKLVYEGIKEETVELSVVLIATSFDSCSTQS